MPYKDAYAVIERQKKMSESIRQYRDNNKGRMRKPGVDERLEEIESQSSSSTNGTTIPLRSTVPL